MMTCVNCGSKSNSGIFVGLSPKDGSARMLCVTCHDKQSQPIQPQTQPVNQAQQPTKPWPISLLDWFAGMAMQRLIDTTRQEDAPDGNYFGLIAETAYDMAQAMLAEKAKREAKTEQINEQT